MKKVLFLTLCFLLISNSAVDAETIKLRPTASVSGVNKRTPIRTPVVNLNYGVLEFDSSCIGSYFNLVHNDTIVFSCVVGGTGFVELPDYLTGVFELRLQRGSTTFVGKIFYGTIFPHDLKYASLTYPSEKNW